MPAFAPVLRPAAAGDVDAAEVSVVIVEGVAGEVVVFLLEDDADAVVEWLVGDAVGVLAGAASMENRGDDTSSSPSQLPPKGMNLSTKSFASCTSSAGISMVHEYRSLSLMLIPSAMV